MIKENGKYRVLMSLYWMLFCVGYGYVTYFLVNWNFSASEVGIITAVFGVLAALLQPLLGKLADRGGALGWKPLLLFMSTGALLIMISLYFLHAKIWIGIFYGLFLMLLSAMMPLVNAANFYYQNQGKKINFGVARGLGSLGYAAVSMLLGKWTALFGVEAVSLSGIVLGAMFVGAVFMMPYDSQVVEKEKEKETSQKKGDLEFFRRYPAFTMMLVGCVGLLTFHNVVCTYLLQVMETLGGNSTDMGTALAISAVIELPVMFGFSYLSKKISAGNLLVISGVSFVIKGILYLLAGNVWWIYGAQIFQMTSFALFASASVYYADECMGAEDKVKGQAYMSMTITMGAVIGNLIGGWILEGFGVSAMLIVAILVAVIGTIIILNAVKKRQMS